MNGLRGADGQGEKSQNCAAADADGGHGTVCKSAGDSTGGAVGRYRAGARTGTAQSGRKVGKRGRGLGGQAPVKHWYTGWVGFSRWGGLVKALEGLGGC